MSLVSQLLTAAHVFAAARRLSTARVSTLLFNDGKRLDRLAAGKDIYTATFERAMHWLSDNWPNGAIWPADVPRPVPSVQQVPA